MESADPVALVTGGAGGIGSEICAMFASIGVNVVVHYRRSESEAHQVVDRVQSLGREGIALQADLSHEPDVQRLVEKTIDRFGRLDTLVNNAGWTKAVTPKDLSGLSDEVVDRTLSLKVHAPLYCFRAAREHLAAKGSGHVVNITSAAGIASRGSSMIYSAANAALSTLTRAWALTFAPEIRVNAVAPGFVDTGFAFPQNADVARRVAENNHRGRTVTAAEIAAAVRFLCTNSAITGEEILVDAGIARLGKRQV